jgi:drug/metabolite transporter (DMT)-like permease
MPLSALALVLTAALLHAVWNVAAKTAASRGADHRFAFLTAIATVLLWLPAAAFVAPRELPQWGVAQWLALLASAVVHVVYYQTLLRGYREADLTVVYPVARGSAPLVTAAAAVPILGESIHALGVAGVLGICGGVFLIAGGPAMLRSLRAAAPHGGGDAAARAEAARQRQRLRAGLAWGGATGALIALYSTIDGYAIKVLAMGPLLFDWMCNVLRLPLQAPMVWRERGTLPALWRVHWRQALIVSALGPLAYILVLTALQQAPLSHVAPMREVSLLFAALIGGHLLGERDRGQRLAGAGLIALGVVLLAFGAPGH